MMKNTYSHYNKIHGLFKGAKAVSNLIYQGTEEGDFVKITDISGNLVYETTSEGGSVTWDTTAFGKYRVASGVYLVLVSSDDAILTNVIKIMIIR